MRTRSAWVLLKRLMEVEERGYRGRVVPDGSGRLADTIDGQRRGGSR